MSDAGPVVVVPTGGTDTPDVADVVQQAVAPFVTVIEELTDALSERDSAPREPDAVVVERLVNVERDVEELNEAGLVTRQDLDNYMNGVIELATAQAVAAAEEIVEEIVTPDVDDEPTIDADEATIVIPDAADHGDDGKRKNILHRIW